MQVAFQRNAISAKPAHSEDPNSSDALVYRAGTGNWRGFIASGLSLNQMKKAAAEWAKALSGIERPWLCWNVDSAWNVVQQRLVRSVGWTPVVGFDPRVGPPPLEAGAVLIDFNEHFRLPTMWMHFPLEFIFLYADRLAFWHADCLIRPEKMRHIADMFYKLEDGAVAAVEPTYSWRQRLQPRNLRYWEVVACTTRGASTDLYDKGCGWWMNFCYHPMTPPEELVDRAKHYWDVGAGIRYWHKKCGGKVEVIPEEYIKEGHFTGIGRSDYKRKSPNNWERNLSLELSLNNDLVKCCEQLQLRHLI